MTHTSTVVNSIVASPILNWMNGNWHVQCALIITVIEIRVYQIPFAVPLQCRRLQGFIRTWAHWGDEGGPRLLPMIALLMFTNLPQVRLLQRHLSPRSTCLSHSCWQHADVIACLLAMHAIRQDLHRIHHAQQAEEELLLRHAVFVNGKV